jgi:flagellar basal body-associated protein FliL
VAEVVVVVLLLVMLLAVLAVLVLLFSEQQEHTPHLQLQVDKDLYQVVLHTTYFQVQET